MHHRFLFSLLVASVLFVHPFSFGAVVERLEAAVNSNLILRTDVSQFKRNLELRAQLDPLFQGTTLAEKGAGAPFEEVVEFLIEERLILIHFPVSDAEVEQEISSIQSANRIDRSQLRQTLREQGFAFEDYFELIRAGVAKRNLVDREIRSKVTITDDDIKNYFYNHRTQSKTATKFKYTIKLIGISPSNYKTPELARRAANEALQRLKGGEPFEEVARGTSDDPSAETGGDLGTLDEDQLSPLIKKQIVSLKVGEISSVFGDARSGYFILKLANKSSNDDDALKKSKEEIRNHLSNIEFQRQIALWLERQKALAHIYRAGPLILKK